MGPSILPGSKGMLAQLYRAFRGVLTPQQVDESELWQLASLLGLEEEGKSRPIRKRGPIEVADSLPGVKRVTGSRVLAVMPPTNG